MNTTQKEKVTLSSLAREVALLRSAVIGLIGHDEEGEYRSEFVEDIKASASEPVAGHFKDPDDFLKTIKGK